MFEIFEIIALTVLTAQLADRERLSSWIWGSATLLACVVSVLLIPLPYIRILFVLVGVFAAMTMFKIVGARRGSDSGKSS